MTDFELRVMQSAIHRKGCQAANMSYSVLGVHTAPFGLQRIVHESKYCFSQDKTRQDKTFIIKISPVQFLGTQLAENASRGVPN